MAPIDRDSKKAFITGGTGFVGFFVAKSLIENGLNVIALIRKSSSESSVHRLKAIGAEVITGNILEPETYCGVLGTVRYVFHCAAIHKIWTDKPKQLYRANVDATKLLLDAAIEQGVEQFIYTSSIKTIGLVPGGGVSNEATAYNLWDVDGDYGKSKYLAEKILLECKEKISIKILNPAAAIGPGDYTLTPTMELINSFRLGKTKVSFDTCMGLIDVRDVGFAHYLAINKARPKQRYILCAKNVSLDELFSHLSKLTDIHAPDIKIPYWLAYPIACLGLSISRVTKTAPLIHPKSLKIARLNPRYDGRKAQEELGLNYRGIEDTLKDTVEWLRNNYTKQKKGCV
jgi:dihydroflavonol-4-reductase